VVPNTIDFDYVFANASFADNITIYMCLIVTMTIYICLLIWASVYDRRDEKRLVSRPMVDNRIEDKYMYEILVFTGHKRGASCDSKLEIVLTGEYEETETRIVDPGAKADAPGFEGTLRKGCVDSYVMKVPRPLGPLSYLRIWHDNTGRGYYASWHCMAVLVRDVQTGDKYEFIANKWLATEHDDGQVSNRVPIVHMLAALTASYRLTD